MNGPTRTLLLTGVYGAGKSSVVEELATLFDDHQIPYGALDLDWLRWFNPGHDDERRSFAIMLRNLEGVVGNYVDAGVDRFVMALSVEHRWQLDGIRGVVPAPLQVARLEVPIDVLRSRLQAAPTSGRRNDLAQAERWLDEGMGDGLEDFSVSSDRPVREVVDDLLARLDWYESDA